MTSVPKITKSYCKIMNTIFNIGFGFCTGNNSIMNQKDFWTDAQS